MRHRETSRLSDPHKMSYAGQVFLGPDNGRIDSVGLNYYGVCPEFTTVLFKPGDYIGLVCALLSLIPPAVLMMHLSAFLSRRTAQDLWFAGGQVICEGSNFVLKRLMKQPRPQSPVLNMPEESYGMPSAHSQFMGFLVGYMVVQMYFSPHLPKWDRVFRISGMSLLAGLVGFARYYLYYHSPAQVAMGLTFGFLLGSFWFLVSVPLRKFGVVAWVVSLWPCRLLLIKDVDYNVREEYQSYVATVNKRKN